MIPLFHHPAITEDEDDVRILHRGQSMSHDNHGSVLPIFLKDSLYCSFSLGVQIGGRFVQEEQSWVPDERSGYCKPLFLATG